MTRDPVTVAVVYPELLGTYGDGGNALVLAQRLRWRGHAARVIEVPVGTPVPRLADLYVVGGAEDAAQVLAASLLVRDAGLRAAAESGRPILAVCAGFQILGRSFDAAGGRHEGVGLIDAESRLVPRAARAVGELLGVPSVAEAARLPVVTGYENHAARTTLGPAARPLAQVVSGVGNGDGTDGAVQGPVVATYAHGPVLARNPALGDLLLTRVVGPLPDLSNDEEDELRRERLTATVRRWWPRFAHGARAVNVLVPVSPAPFSPARFSPAPISPTQHEEREHPEE